MRVNGPQQIDKQCNFAKCYDEKAVSNIMAGFGFFPRGLLDPLSKHLFESGNAAAVFDKKEFKQLLTPHYYFKNQIVWNEESRNDGYYMDLHGNHIYFKIIFAENLGEENVVFFGMYNRKTIPKDVYNFANCARRAALAANKEMSRVIKEFYKLPIGVAHKAYTEYRDFFKVASKFLIGHRYLELHTEGSFFMRDEGAPMGSVFLQETDGFLGKIWFSHKGYTYGKGKPGPITLVIMFEDPEVADKINTLAIETYKWMTLNDQNVVAYREEQIMRKLQGDKEESDYLLHEIKGFEYFV